MTDEVNDGFGNIWERCIRADCDLNVVRPGKVQCSGDSDAIGCPRGTPDDLDIARTLVEFSKNGTP